MVARRQEKLWPQGETQIGCFHSYRLVFMANVMERSHKASPSAGSDGDPWIKTPREPRAKGRPGRRSSPVSARFPRSDEPKRIAARA